MPTELPNSAAETFVLKINRKAMIRAKSPSHKSVAVVCWGQGEYGFFTSEFCSAIENFILKMFQKFED